MSNRILGLWSMGDSQGFHLRKDPRILKNTIKSAYRSGVRIFDTAYSYNESDSMLSSSMREMHITDDQYKVISKVMPLPTLRKKAETGLRRLNISSYDTLLLHWPDEENLFRSLKTLESLKSEGLARRIGVSNFPAGLLDSVSHDFEIEAHERCYSPLFQKDIEKESVPLLLYGIYSFGSLLRDSIPEDRRKDLFYYRNSSYPAFLNLRMKIRELSEKYKTEERLILLSFAESAMSEGIILGATDPDMAETIMEEAPVLESSDIEAIKKLGKEVEHFNPSDNVFSHDWK